VDSAIIAEQVRQEAPRIKPANMKALHAEARQLLTHIGEPQVRISWLPREPNREAVSERQTRSSSRSETRGLARKAAHSRPKSAPGREA
jgi:hypothetical protein